MKVGIIIGTRPEIIKMSPLIRACEKNEKIEYFVLHTGQHYSYELDKKMFEDLELSEPKYNLEIGSAEYRKQIGEMVSKITGILSTEKPDIIYIEGDTNTVLAGAIAASNLGIKVGHVEAGLRSHDLRMQEEINRINADNLSEFLFAPTENSVENLKNESIIGKIFMTGNTITDAVIQNLEIANKKVDILKNLGLEKQNYIVVTIHRAENVDDKDTLKKILEGLEAVGKEFNISLIYPIHPRTEKMIENFSLTKPNNIRFISPLGFLEFLQLESNAKLIITDSGGLQEEASILKVPCVTVRISTERPETIEAGVNIIAGTTPKGILESAKKMMDKQIIWKPLYGDGNAAQKIIDLTLKDFTSSAL